MSRIYPEPHTGSSYCQLLSFDTYWVNPQQMAKMSSNRYEAPEVVKHGAVESITKAGNKKQPGTDVDEPAINLKGSVGYK